MAEVSVHDAGAARSFKPILIRLAYAFQEALDVRAVARGKPLVHIGTSRIVIRHPRASCQRVDLREDKISDVADAFAAKVAPKVRVALDVSKGAAVIVPPGQNVVNRSMES